MKLIFESASKKKLKVIKEWRKEIYLKEVFISSDLENKIQLIMANNNSTHNKMYSESTYRVGGNIK